jgi:hypothetical protein
VPQSLTVPDKIWRRAATLVAAADRGSRPEWPPEDLLADPAAASLLVVEAETGSFSSVLRASLKSARQSPVKTALVAGGLLAIPPAVEDNVKLVLPDRPPERCRVATRSAPPGGAGRPDQPAWQPTRGNSHHGDDRLRRRTQGGDYGHGSTRGGLAPAGRPGSERLKLGDARVLRSFESEDASPAARTEAVCDCGQ